MKRMIYSLVIVFSLAFVNTQINAQTIDLSSVDYSGYPFAKAEFLLKGPDNKTIWGLGNDDLVVYENSLQRIINSINCSDSIANVSLILLLDRSQSMCQSRIDPDDPESPFRLYAVKESAKNWVDQMLPGHFECCVISFSAGNVNNPRLVHPFSDDKITIKDSIETIVCFGATDYNSAFFGNPITGDPGAFHMARQAKYKPIIIFVTDGSHDAPDYPPGNARFHTGRVLDSAEATNTTIYALTLGVVGGSSLTDLNGVCAATGGEIYSDLTESEINNVYHDILERLDPEEYNGPCTLEFETDCDGGGIIVLESVEYGVSDTLQYEIPDSLLPAIESYEETISFFNVPPGETDTIEFTIKALNFEIVFTDIYTNNPMFNVISLGDYNLAAGTETLVKVAYTSEDSLCHEAKLIIESNACDETIIDLKAGFLFSSDVVFDSTFINSSQSLMLDNAICNWTCDSVIISQILISGENVSDFELSDDTETIVISPGECYGLKYRFLPSDTGRREAEILFKTEDFEFGSKLTGIGKRRPSDIADNNNEYFIHVSPNPFSESSVISYQMSDPGQVRIDVYNSLGNKITTLVDDYREAGEHRAVFSADDLPQGMYYFTIRIGDRIESGTMLLVR